jgi:hypothetical protein
MSTVTEPHGAGRSGLGYSSADTANNALDLHPHPIDHAASRQLATRRAIGEDAVAVRQQRPIVRPTMTSNND